MNYLRQIEDLDSLIEAKQDAYEVVMVEATQVTQRLKDVYVQSSKDHTRHETLLAKMADLSTQIDQKKMELINLKGEVLELIEELENNTYKTILIFKYVNGRPLEYIAKRMCYSRSWIYTLHDRAVKDFLKRVDKKGQR